MTTARSVSRDDHQYSSHELKLQELLFIGRREEKLLAEVAKRLSPALQCSIFSEYINGVAPLDKMSGLTPRRDVWACRPDWTTFAEFKEMEMAGFRLARRVPLDVDGNLMRL